MTQFHRQMSKTQTKQTGTGTSSSASDVVSTDPSQSEQEYNGTITVLFTSCFVTTKKNADWSLSTKTDRIKEDSRFLTWSSRNSDLKS